MLSDFLHNIISRCCCVDRYTDMESEDYDFYRGLVFLLENNVADLGYELTFGTEASLNHQLWVMVAAN